MSGTFKEDNKMSFQRLPDEVITQELLLNLDAESLAAYCPVDRRARRFCRQPRFWQSLVSRRSRRVIQEEWFLYFAKSGETALLSDLVGEINRRAMILDDRAVTYAALDLLEQQRLKPLSRGGTTLLDSFLLRAARDKTLSRLLGGLNLEQYFDMLFQEVKRFRGKLEEGLLVHPRSLIYGRRIFQTEERREPIEFYLGEYEDNYVYEHVEDVLPPVKEYLELAMSTSFGGANIHYLRDSLDFTINLIPLMVSHGQIEEVSSILAYAEDTEELSSENDKWEINWYLSVVRKMAEKLSYDDLVSLVPDVENFIEHGTYSGPVDPILYYKRISSFNPRVGSDAFRCMDPQEFIKFLNGSIGKDKVKPFMEKSKMRAENSGYSYFSTVIGIKLHQLNIK